MDFIDLIVDVENMVLEKVKTRTVLFLGVNDNPSLPDVRNNLILYFSQRDYEIYEAPSPYWKSPAVDLRMDLGERGKGVLSGVNVDSFLNTTVARIKYFHDYNAIETELCELLLPHLIYYWSYLKETISTLKPSYVVLSGDYSPEAMMTAILCRKLGIPVLAVEICFLKDYFNLELTTGICCNKTSFSTWEWSYHKYRSLTKEQIVEVRTFLKERDKSMYSLKSSDGQAQEIDERLVHRQLDIPFDAKIALVIGQVPCDCVITNDMHAFDSFYEFVCKSVNSFTEHDDWYVVVRLHPQEAYHSDKTLKALKNQLFDHARVRFVADQEINTYSLMNCASFGLVINSQAGLEMVMQDKPMIVCGDAFYGNKGFTFDVSDGCLLQTAVSYMVENHTLSELKRAKRDLFLYIYMNEVLFPRDYDKMALKLDQQLGLMVNNDSISCNVKTAWSFDRDIVLFDLDLHLNDEIEGLCTTAKKILIYGTGTVCEQLLHRYPINLETVTFCSIDGGNFEGHPIYKLEELDINDFDLILVTPKFSSKTIFRRVIRPLLNERFEGTILTLSQTIKLDSQLYYFEVDK